MSKAKNNIKINGTNFNKLAVQELPKDDFIKMHLAVDDVFPDAKDKEKQLGEAYDLITKAPKEEKAKAPKEEK